MEVRKKTYVHAMLMDGFSLEPQEVKSRDWEEIDLPENIESFFFFDQAVILQEIDGCKFKWFSTPQNDSPWHYLNARLLDLEEFELEFADNPNIDIMLAQIKELNIETMIITASGIPVPYEEGDILIEYGDN